jgi:transposase
MLELVSKAFFGCSRTEFVDKIYQKDIHPLRPAGATQGMERRRAVAQGLGEIDSRHGSAKFARLVACHGRRHLFLMQKGGREVGKTKKGKGTKLMLLTEIQGTAISASTTSAPIAEVHTTKTLVALRATKRRPKRLIYDKAADSDWIRDSLACRGIGQITPHRKGQKKRSRQNGRSHRRYLHRWKTERTTSWLQYQRRLLVRHAHLFEGSYHRASTMLCLKGFEIASSTHCKQSPIRVRLEKADASTVEFASPQGLPLSMPAGNPPLQVRCIAIGRIQGRCFDEVQ